MSHNVDREPNYQNQALALGKNKSDKIIIIWIYYKKNKEITKVKIKNLFKRKNKI